MSEAHSSKLAARISKSPLALYLLAVAEQGMPDAAPWAVSDDPEDLFRVTLACKTGHLAVRVSQRFAVRFEAEPPNGWSKGLERQIESALEGVYIVGERQLEWHNRSHKGVVTPAGGESR